MSESVASNLGNVLGSVVKGSRTVGKQLGFSAAQVARSSAHFANNTAKGFSEEMDRNARSPLLDCFLTGSGIQLRAESGGGCLRCLADGRIDAMGALGTDYTSHWVIENRWENKVVFRNAAYPQFHLIMLDTGLVTGATGPVTTVNTFKLHETFDHFIRMEHEFFKRPISVNENGDVVCASQHSCSLFEVHLAFSPFGHTYSPTHK